MKGAGDGDFVAAPPALLDDGAASADHEAAIFMRALAIMLDEAARRLEEAADVVAELMRLRPSDAKAVVALQDVDRLRQESRALGDMADFFAARHLAAGGWRAGDTAEAVDAAPLSDLKARFGAALELVARELAAPEIFMDASY